MNKQLAPKKTVLCVTGIYAAAVLCRFLLALFTSAYPVTNIDEFLYYGMARSIAEGNGLMFRGQAAEYSYILYSLVLSPVYLLGLRGPVLFRVMQLWNILLSSLSVFPLFCIAQRTIRDERKVPLAVALSMLLPDFMLGQLMMCENIILPLFYTLIAFTLLYLERTQLRRALAIGVVGGLLISAKPGALIPAAVLVLLLLITGIRNKDRKRILHTALGVVLTVAVSAALFGIVALLGGQASVISIYRSQVADGKHLDVFFKFLAIYALYIVLAGGVGCFAVSFRKWRAFSPDQKLLFCAMLISLAITIIGVSWSVNRYEYNANTAHMRYIGMYLPVIYCLALVPPAEVKQRRGQPVAKKNPTPWIVLIITALLLVIGIYSGVNRYSVFVENMTFAVLISAFRAQISVWLVTGIALIVIALWFWILYHKEQTVMRAVTVSLVACMLVNGIAAYSLERKDTLFDYAKQAKELTQQISDDDEPMYLYTTQTTTGYYGALDAYSRKSIPFVRLNDMFNHLYEARGVYRPFLPEEQRGTVTTQMTPDTDTILMDLSVYDMLKRSEENTSHVASEGGALHLIRIRDKTKPWLDAVIGNTKNHVLDAGDTGILLIFNERYLQSPCTLTIQIKSETDGLFSIYSMNETKTQELQAGLHEYQIVFDRPADAYNFETDCGEIRLYGFDLTN